MRESISLPKFLPYLMVRGPSSSGPRGAGVEVAVWRARPPLETELDSCWSGLGGEAWLLWSWRLQVSSASQGRWVMRVFRCKVTAPPKWEESACGRVQPEPLLCPVSTGLVRAAQQAHGQAGCSPGTHQCSPRGQEMVRLHWH